MFYKRPSSSVVKGTPCRKVSPWEFIAHHPQNREKIPVLMKTAFYLDGHTSTKGDKYPEKTVPPRSPLKQILHLSVAPRLKWC